MAADGSVAEALVATGLASSLTEARRLLAGNAVAINGKKTTDENFSLEHFEDGKAMIRKGKKYKDSALIERI
jgi:tyrosyl-tRNA synthetase